MYFQVKNTLKKQSLSYFQTLKIHYIVIDEDWRVYRDIMPNFMSEAI